MKEMLKLENVQILQRVHGWEQAVQVAVQPLVDGGYAEPRYIDGIIANAHELGPYFVLCPDLALLHARPEQGALKQQLAVTVLREPVRFKEEGPDVRVLVTLVATDSDSHIDVMRQLAMMFGDPANIANVAEAATEHEIYDLFLSQE